MLLEGKVAIVTGIGPGMGRDIALAFAREGARLALGSRNETRLGAIAREVEALGAPVLTHRTDLTDRESCRGLVEATIARFGGVDILVQNGHHDGDYKPAVEADVDEWRAIMQCNFFGALHLAQFAVPSMKSRGEGRIILINSGASYDPPPAMGAYAASKSALASLVRTLAVELGPDGIRANGVHLGPVDGENFRGYAEEMARESGRTTGEVLQEFAAAIPLRYLPPSDECAGAVVFLASPLARPITGQSLCVNGGQWFG